MSQSPEETLYVIGCISNPARFNSRYRLYRQWESEMLTTKKVKFFTVESAFGNRKYEITVPRDNALQVKSKSEIWIKENLINLGVRYLFPRDWKYMAWVDCDISFRNENWAEETIHRLQHHNVVQPFEDAIDLGHTGNILQTFKSFGFRHQEGGKKQAKSSDPYPYGHSGFAWACTRSFWEQSQGLLDFAILGSADHHMAWAMIGEVGPTIFGGMPPSYGRRCFEWQQRAVISTKKQVGYTDGRIEHFFHGPKVARQYQSRWKILVDHQFDPDKNLIRDSQGVIHLFGKPDLEQAIHRYNLSRREDSID